VCRALKVMCAAADAERLELLKRASVAATWELVGGAITLDELVKQIDEWRPDVVVVDAALGPGAAERIRAAHRRARVVSVGPMAAADAVAALPEDVRSAILGISPPGGPIRV
jgi:hypothetical protein